MLCGYPWWSVAVICLGVFAAGLVDAIGGGGGLISLPTYLLVGLPTHLALGTNKLSSCLGTTASTARYIKKGYVDPFLAIPSAVLAVIGAHFGTSLQLMADETYLRYFLIVVLVFAAAVLIKEKHFSEEPQNIGKWKQFAAVSVTALVVGMYDGFYGPGSGTFMLILFCRVAKLDLRTASGNVKVTNLASNIGALATSLSAGKVLVPLGLIAAVFAFLGQYIGAGLMIKNGTKIVTPVIFGVLGLLFVRIILEIIGII